MPRAGTKAAQQAKADTARRHQAALARAKVNPLEPLMSVEEIADYFQVSKHTVYRLIATRKLKHLRLGQHIRVKASVVEAYLDANTYAARQPAGRPRKSA